jgi:hypothetical protein
MWTRGARAPHSWGKPVDCLGTPWGRAWGRTARSSVPRTQAAETHGIPVENSWKTGG